MLRKTTFQLTATAECPQCKGNGEIRNPAWLFFEHECWEEKYTYEERDKWAKDRGFNNAAEVGESYIPCKTCEGKKKITYEADLIEALIAHDLLCEDDGKPIAPTYVNERLAVLLHRVELLEAALKKAGADHAD